MRKFLLVILDGAADRGRSAFKKAKMPNLDMLASNSICGIWSGPRAPHYNPRSLSSVATLEILGYSYRDEPGRGYLEALGAGLETKNALCIRGNFSFVRKMKIVDRRAGRSEAGLDKMVRDLNRKIKSVGGVKIRVYRIVGHRVVVVLSGRGLSKDISDGDAGRRIRKIRPLSPGSKRTADIVNEFLEKSHELLSSHPANKRRKMPANYILLRGAGSYQKVRGFRQKYGMRACSISGVNIIRGISKYLGIDIIPAKFSQIEDDLASRAKKAVDALEKYDFVILHINGADTCAHNRNFRAKVKYLEKTDREVFSQLARARSVNIAVISDHITDSRSGEHLFGPVPFMIYDSEDENGAEGDESYRRFVADNPMKKILSM